MTPDNVYEYSIRYPVAKTDSYEWKEFSIHGFVSECQRHLDYIKTRVPPNTVDMKTIFLDMMEDVCGSYGLVVDDVYVEMVFEDDDTMVKIVWAQWVIDAKDDLGRTYLEQTSREMVQVTLGYDSLTYKCVFVSCDVDITCHIEHETKEIVLPVLFLAQQITRRDDILVRCQEYIQSVEEQYKHANVCALQPRTFDYIIL